MKRPQRNDFHSLLGWALAVATLAALCGCLPEHLRLRRYGQTARVRLTLEEIWETALENCCAHGRTLPEEVEVSCSPADRCKAVVLRNPSGPPPELLLDVIGFSPGLADVEVRYRQFDSQTWLTDHVPLEFVPTKPLPMLELGMGRPKGSFKFDHLSAELLAHGVKGPARCDLESDFHEQYACFGVVELLGEKRYHSCANSVARCDAGHGIRWGRFRITLRRDRYTGRIFRFSISALTEWHEEELGTWE